MLIDKIIEVLSRAKNQIETDDVRSEEHDSLIQEIDRVLAKLQHNNPDKNGFFYWILQVGIHKTWVADGVDFTDKKLHDILTHAFKHAYGHELSGSVLGRPPDKVVAEAMGFKSVKDYLEDRKD